MNFFRRMSPFRAIQDLRLFLAQRKRYELGFFALSLVITGALIGAFIKDSHIPTPYKRNIIYFKSWPADRSEAEILAQQKIDSAEKAKQEARLEKLRKKRQAEFKKVDEALDSWGI